MRYLFSLGCQNLPVQIVGSAPGDADPQALSRCGSLARWRVELNDAVDLWSLRGRACQ